MAKISKLQPTQSRKMQESTVSQKNPRNIYNLYTSTFSQLTADNVKQYLETARRGLNFEKSLLFDEIRRRDSHIGAVCQTRKLAVAACPFKVTSEDTAMQEYCDKLFKRFNAVNFVTDIVEASIQGVSVFEINYLIDPELGAIPGEVILLPNHLIMYDENADEYKILDIEKTDYWQLRTVSANTITDTIPIDSLPQVTIDPLKLLQCHAFDGNSRNGLQNGCIDALMWLYFFKSYGIKDWATYLERYATPTRIGKYDDMNGINPADRASFTSAVQNIGHNAYAVIPKSFEIDFLTDQGKGSSSDLYTRYIDYFNEQASIRVLGQTLTTKMEGTGSYAAAKVHENVRQDILFSDMKLVEMTVNDLLRRTIDLNFASVKEYPVFEFIEAENLEYMKAKSEIYTALSGLGFKPTAEQIEQEFGIEAIAEAKKKVDKVKKETTADPEDIESKDADFSEQDADDEIKKLIEEIWHTQSRQTS